MTRATLVAGVLAALVSASCSSSSDTPVDDAGGPTDAGSVDTSLADGAIRDTAPVSDARLDETDAASDDTLPATDYCETIADFFCEYYLRCGRTATASPQECRDVFLESCNEIFEPQYAALADAGKLRLSTEGIAACERHLSDVACEQQMFDLDGGCADVWEGLSAAGEPCAPGIGSFVCGAGTACVIDLDFCGECKPAVGIGEDCSGDEVCSTAARCIDGLCVERALPGQSCSDARPCVTGATCVAGTCTGFDVVDVGDACDRARRCPYTSTCTGGVCVRDALLGEDCTDASCASGRCVDGTCRPFVAAGGPCTDGAQCLSGACAGDTCEPPLSSCFTDP